MKLRIQQMLDFRLLVFYTVAKKLSFTKAAAELFITQPAVSRHLKVLEQAGLITRRVEGAKRPCRLAPGGIAELDRWLDGMRAALARNYDRLDDVLAEMNSEEDLKERETL